MSDPLANAPPDSPFHPVVVISASPPPHDPPPPYPSQERRTRAPRAGRRRRTLEQASESASQGLAISSGGTELQHDAIPPTIHQQFESDEQDGDATETTPLLGPSGSSPRVPVRLPAGIMGRQRTLSLTSTVRSTHSVAPSLAQTVLSAFNPERDCDVDADCDDPHQDSSESSQSTPLDSPTLRHSGPLDDQQRAFVAELIGQRVDRRRDLSWAARWRRYYRPLGKRAYYASLFHLLVLNFPYALLAWIYLFVFTVVRTLLYPLSERTFTVSAGRYDDPYGSTSRCRPLLHRPYWCTPLVSWRGMYHPVLQQGSCRCTPTRQHWWSGSNRRRLLAACPASPSDYAIH